jgi:hypothetical protein
MTSSCPDAVSHERQTKRNGHSFHQCLKLSAVAGRHVGPIERAGGSVVGRTVEVTLHDHQ